MALSNAERQRRWRSRQRQQRQQTASQPPDQHTPLISTEGVTEFGVTLDSGEHVAFVVVVPVQAARVARGVIDKVPALVAALRRSGWSPDQHQSATSGAGRRV